jgi:anti-sigma B factor antagonist
MRTPFEVTEEVRDAVRVVVVRGELDLDSSGGIEGPLARAAEDLEHPLVIDLTACTFIDSVGLAKLLHGAKPLQDGGSNVAVVCPEGEVRNLLRLTALDQTLPVFDGLEDALAALRAGS